MQLLGALSVMRRHWFIMTVGVLLGVLATGAVQYQYDAASNGIRRREIVRYDGTMQVLVVDPRFTVGRIGGENPGGDQFDKTITLAATYADLIVSDAVRASADESSGIGGVSATAERVQDSPIVEVSLSGYDPERVTAYGNALVQSLEVYLRRQQDAAAIPAQERVSVRMLSAPVPDAVRSRQWEMALLAFAVPVLLTFGVASVLDRPRPKMSESPKQHGTAA